MKSTTRFSTLLQAFFTQRLMQQKQVSTHTIESYRDTFLSVANCNSAAIDLDLTDLRSGWRGVMFSAMREWLILVAHLVVTIIKIAAPGGARSVVAESLILKHQLLILNRSRKRAPRLGPVDRLLLGLGTLLVSPRRLIKVAVAIRPAT